MIPLPLLINTSPEECEITDFISKGNTKLGTGVYTFSLPAVYTCAKGSTETCRSLCYADKSFFTTNSVKEKYWKNLTVSGRRDFDKLIIRLLSKARGSLLRWHVSGDFYSAGYAHSVLRIFRSLADIKIWLYTRTWRDPEILSILCQIATLPNVQLWFSCDRDTGEPKERPGSVRLAYMQISDDDVPDYDVDLFFRDGKVRKSVVKRIKGTLVCPVENGITNNTTCEACRICFTNPAADRTRRTKR